jgi:uncharacterized delta-60 repeat protein
MFLITATFAPLPANAGSAGSGHLDPRFGNGGVVTTTIEGAEFANSVAIQPDGKILATGSSNLKFAVIRYNPDGTLDATFGAGGVVVTGLERLTGYASSIALQQDGKIVLAGSEGRGALWTFAIVRLNPNGTLDITFGTGGEVLVDFSGFGSYVAHSLAIQADGKILVAGSHSIVDIIEPPGGVAGFVLARFNSDGSFDSSFGDGGSVIARLGQPLSLTLQPDGKIVTAGDIHSSSGFSMVLARFNADGSVDPTFGIGGNVVTSGSQGFARAFALTAQPDGLLVVAGVGFGGALVARFDPDGKLDPTFGDGGVVATVAEAVASSAALQQDGKIIAAGTRSRKEGSDVFVLRLNQDGSPDTGFASKGRVITDIGFKAEARGVAVGPGGEILVAGLIADRNDSATSFLLAQYQSDNPARSLKPLRRPWLACSRPKELSLVAPRSQPLAIYNRATGCS